MAPPQKGTAICKWRVQRRKQGRHRRWQVSRAEWDMKRHSEVLWTVHPQGPHTFSKKSCKWSLIVVVLFFLPESISSIYTQMSYYRIDSEQNRTVVKKYSFYMWHFSVSGSHPGSCITLSCHVSLGSCRLWQFFRLSLFYDLTILRSTGQVLCGIFLNWNLSGVFLIIELR